MTTAKKPPTQVAGVDGIAPLPIVLTPEAPEAPEAIDWQRLLSLPPFQMFVTERAPELLSAFESDDLQTVSAWMQRYEPETLYREYSQWHLAKGYWPNETPMGELLEFRA